MNRLYVRSGNRIYIGKKRFLSYAVSCVGIGVGLLLGLLGIGLLMGDAEVSAGDIRIVMASSDKESIVKRETAQSFRGNMLADGKYAVDVDLTSGGSGKASVETPTLMVIEEGRCHAQITWSSSNYDYMIVDGTRYENQSGNGGNSSFMIPILAFDEDMPVIADTLAMGEPHEIQYTLQFYSDSIASESSLPKEGAKRVLMMAAAIIVVGGILNHYMNRRRRNDYCV